MIRKALAWAVFVAALLLLTLPGYFLQERNGGDVTEVHNASETHIWIASDSAVSDILVQLSPGESGPVCLRGGAGDVDVYDVDPTVDPPPNPLFTLPFGDRDFCDGSYRWDGSTLSPVP